MRKIKHSKFKNTGIIFELLSNQIASDVLSQQENISLDLIKKYYRKGTELHKDLSCYHTLMESRGKNDIMASKILDVISNNKSEINSNKLNREKYNLIGDIKKNYNVTSFFESRVSNYKLYASIYKFLEYKSIENPRDHIEAYDVILEYVTSKPQNTISDVNIFDTQSKDIKKLTLKILVEKFNDKYKNLNSKQRKLISRFVNENVQLEPFKEFIHEEVNYIQSKLNTLQNSVNDKLLKIKINEVTKLTQEIITSKIIKDEHVSSMLKYYQLIDHLSKGK